MKKLSKLCVAVLLMSSVTAFAAKPLIGVAEFRNETSAAWWSGGVGWELSSMVSNELANNGKFKVVERSKLEPVLIEQDLAASGRIAQGTGAKIGKLTGAQYLVMGTISAYEQNTESTGGGISISGISIGGKKKQAYIAADLRVVDTTTGEIDYARTIEARSGGFGVNLGVFRSGFGGRLSKEKKTPAGKAIRAMLVEIVDYLECVMVVKGDCIAEFDAKEQKRKKSLKDTISLD